MCVCVCENYLCVFVCVRVSVYVCVCVFVNELARVCTFVLSSHQINRGRGGGGEGDANFMTKSLTLSAIIKTSAYFCDALRH